MDVVRWVSWAEAQEMEDSNIGGLGGWFGFDREASSGSMGFVQKSQRWADYLAVWKEEAHPYLEALRREIVAKEIRRGGDWHQEDEAGVPVFSDGTVASYSYRAWGDLLAAIWSEHDDKDYCYMDFYMDSWGDATVVPGA